MIDIIIVICCILSGFAIGKYIEKKINEKGRFYQDFIRYAAALKENVNGRQLSIEKFNIEFCNGCGKIFAEYLDTGKINLRLKKMQKSNIEDFFGNLNCSSSQELLQNIDYHSKIVCDDAKVVLDNEVAKASIYSKLGMLLGAMLGILLV